MKELNPDLLIIRRSF